MGLPLWLSSKKKKKKKSACNTGDADSIPGLGRSPGGGHATHARITAWIIPWTEDPGGLYSPWGHRVGHDWSSWACTRQEKDEIWKSPHVKTYVSSHTKEGIVSVVCVLQELSSAPECLCYLWAANLPSLAQQGPSKKAVSAVIIPMRRNGGHVGEKEVAFHSEAGLCSSVDGSTDETLMWGRQPRVQRGCVCIHMHPQGPRWNLTAQLP